MNIPAALPSLGLAAGFGLIGALFLPGALRTARRLLPAAGALPAEHRWGLGEVLVALAIPVLLAKPLALLAPGAGLLAQLLLTELLLGAAVVFVLVRARRVAAGFAALGLATRPPLRAFLAPPLVFVPLFFFSGGLGAAWTYLCRANGWAEQQEVLKLILALGPRELWLAALVAVFLGPWLEELLFRGFLQPALAQTLGERGGILLTSLVFAGLHGVAGLPVLFTLSLFLGWLQSRTRCLWIPWSAHALNNAVTLALALAARGGYESGS